MATASTPNPQPLGTSASQPTAKTPSQALPKTKKPKSPKKRPFTDEEISQKAYELWKARNGAAGSAEDDWYRAVEVLKKEQSLCGWLKLSWETDNRAFSLDVVKTFISGFGVLATILAGVGLFLTYYNNRQEQKLNTERLITERFSKAVEQLGNSDIEVRIGGIYSLERIAKDSPKDHWTTMEVLTAFVRDKFPLTTSSASRQKKSPPIPTDIQSVLTVIGRRDANQDPKYFHIDLERTNLNEANLFRAHLDGAILNGAHLNEAILNGAHLNEANLNGAHLTEATLEGATLYGAILVRAILNGADLTEACLKQAQALTTNQVKSAEHWQDAYYSPEFRKQLGLPPDTRTPPGWCQD